MQSVENQIIVVMGGVLIALFVIAVYFLVNALKKIDKITEIEFKMDNALGRIKEVVDDVKAILNGHIELEKRIAILENKVEALEREFREKVD
jgi:hypothetical protein